MAIYAPKYRETPKGPSPFKLGDIVRISRVKAVFEKGSTTNWTTELFKIKAIRKTNPWTYYLMDLNGEDITGQFYPQELQYIKSAEPEQEGINKT